MKYWQIAAPKSIKLLETDDYAIGEDCVKIKLTKVGLTSLDNNVYLGNGRVNYPIVPCRQAVGIVIDDGASNSFTRGQRVVIDPYMSCGVCRMCKSGKPDLCEKLVTLGVNEDGLLKDFAVVPTSNLYSLPDHVKDNDAIFIDYISLALNIIGKLNISKGDHIAILGGGISGTILTKVAMYYQAVPIVIDESDSRLELARKADVYYTICSKDTDLVKKVRNLTCGRMCEHVIFMFNSGQGMNVPFDLAANGGNIAFVGWDMNNLAQSENIDLSPLISKHLTAFGVTNGHKLGTNAINFLANRFMDVSQLVSAEIGFADSGAAFAGTLSLPDNHGKIIIKI